MADDILSFDRLIDSVTPEIYQNLKQAIEIGKWPDGRQLTLEQKEHTLQAVIAYEHQHVCEQERVGFIDRGRKKEGEVCASNDEPQPVDIRS